MNQSKEKHNNKTLARLCKNGNCTNKRVTLYYCQPCRESENLRKKLLHRRKKESNRCSDCGKTNNNTKWKCDECNIRSTESSKKSKSNKLAKQGHYGTMKQILEVI